MRTLLDKLFGIDLRSLALLRIGLGVAILADLAARAVDLTGLYTDAGVLPGELLRALDGWAVQLSVHYWAGTSAVLQGLVFAATAACAIALLVGWHTWLATAVCWYLVASVQIRQPLGYMGGDSILRMLLFWGLMLPLGARFSLDAVHGRTRPRPDWLVSPVTACLLLQVAVIYWVTGFRKDGPLWWSGDAVFVALHLDSWATPVGVWLRDAGPALRPVTWATLALELAGPLLAFMPVYTQACRVAAIAVFWSFHLGLASAMNIGLFPLFSMVAWLPFVPPFIWDRAGVRSRPGTAGAGSRLERLAAVAACLVFLYIAVSLAERTRVLPRVLPRPVTALATALRIQQSWSMFAPDPSTATRRFTMIWTADDGTVVEAPATSGFRWTVYLDRVASARSLEDPLGQSLRRFMRAACRDAPPDIQPVRAALRVERREIRPEDGYGPSDVSILAAAACD